MISVLRNKRTPRAACPAWLPTISRQPAAHPSQAKARLLGISGQPEGSAFPFPWPAGGAPFAALRPPAPWRLLAAGRGSAPWGGPRRGAVAVEGWAAAARDVSWRAGREGAQPAPGARGGASSPGCGQRPRTARLARPGPGSQREGRAGMAGQAAEVRRGNGGGGRRPAGKGFGGCSAELPSAWPEGGLGGLPAGCTPLGVCWCKQGNPNLGG